MIIPEMIERLKNDYDSLKFLLNEDRLLHSRIRCLYHLFEITGIDKNKCMELCGYTDIIFYDNNFQFTYDSILSPCSYTRLNYYEEVMLCKHVYKYIHENYDHGIKTKLDVLMFKLL